MTSYMVYKPASALNPTGRHRTAMSYDTPVMTSPIRPQQRGMTSHDGKAMSDGTTMSDGAPEGPCPTPRPTSTFDLSRTAAAQSARPFDHDIPDHILQAWPLVHKVHSRIRNTDTDDGLPTTALTRCRTRNSHGVYRSSVLTPGEVEFMARKREARRRAALQPRPGVARSCTEFFSSSRTTFVTQDGGDESYSDTCRDQYSRMTVDSRASIVPSTIEVTLPARQDTLRRTRSRQDPQLRLAGSAVGGEGAAGGGVTSPRTSALLGREKATGNSIRRSGARDRRRREERRQEQQFILQPTSGPDWYESQGLSTPSVLHKYLNDSFYSGSTGGANTKPEVDTTALLNYIRHKQKNGTYVPPPPSSGSEAEDDGEDEDYQEVRMDASGRVLQAGVGTAAGPGIRPSVSFEDINNSKHDRRTIKENGCFDLLVGGDRLGTPAGGTWSGHVTKATGDWPVTGVSNLQIGHQQKGPVGNKQSAKPHLATTMETSVPDIEVTADNGVNVGEEWEGREEDGVGEEVSSEQRHQGDNTKKITVVLPSSDDVSVKTTD